MISTQKYAKPLFQLRGVKLTVPACALLQILKGYAFTICGTPSPQVVSRSTKDYR